MFRYSLYRKIIYKYIQYIYTVYTVYMLCFIKIYPQFSCDLSIEGYQRRILNGDI